MSLAEETQRHRGEWQVKTEAETGVVQLHAKDCWRPPEAGREAWDRLAQTAEKEAALPAPGFGISGP